MNDADCEYLEWDSDFFGRKIARAKISRLDEDTADRIDNWCSANRIECLYFLADSSDAGTARVAQGRGFRFVDARLTLERGTKLAEGDGGASAVVRRAEERDISALRQLARTAHQDSRFYCDGNFAKPRCDALFETWIEKSYRGWAKRVLVVESDGLAAGYVTCHVTDAGEGQIGLVGVSEKVRGKGLGSSLVRDAVRWFESEGISMVSVVTQGRNAAAQRLYQRCGFVTRSMEFWFHRWFPAKEASE